MNKGSNPVGVASTESNENTEKTRGQEGVQGVPPEHPSPGVIQDRCRWPVFGDLVEWWDGTRWVAGKVCRVGGPTTVKGATRTFNVEGGPGGVFSEALTGGAVYGVHWRWPVGLTGQVVTPVSMVGGATDEKPKRQRKEGLCKRRGCDQPVSHIFAADRLCVVHGGMDDVNRKAAGAVGAQPQVEAGAADTEPHAAEMLRVRDVELYAGGGRWRRVTMSAVSAVGFRAEGADYGWASQGQSWRWPADGIPEEAEQPNDGQPPERRRCLTMDCAGGREPGRGFCAACCRLLGIEGYEQGGPISQGPAVPTVQGCPVDAAPCEAAPLPVRTCIGIPEAVGDAKCHTVLGADVEGDRCSVCRAAVEAAAVEAAATPRLTDLLCARWGCGEARAESSRYCAHHKRISETVAYVALDQAFEAAWQALAESSHLDPQTVAVCKALRDREVTP